MPAVLYSAYGILGSLLSLPTFLLLFLWLKKIGSDVRGNAIRIFFLTTIVIGGMHSANSRAMFRIFSEISFAVHRPLGPSRALPAFDSSEALCLD